MNLEQVVERLKDMKTTLPGTLGLIGVGLVVFKDMVRQVIEWVAGMGYSMTPDREQIVIAILALICLKMIFFEGGRK